MNLGFGSTLLGKPSHDAILKLQEYEIKLLEVIKKTLSSRIKYDKEYGHNLTQLALQGGKLDSPTYDSSLYQAWRELVQELSQTGLCIKQNAETLHSTTYDKLTNLIKDKMAMKKTYAERREKLDSELLKTMHTELDRRHNIYVKMEGEVTSAHHAYDQACSKGKIPAIEKTQDKYRKTTMKLHNYHNDYVLQVEEAQMHQKHYRSKLLPELLNGVQYMEMQYVDTLKEIFSEYLFQTSPCRSEFVGCHKEAESKVTEVNSSTEYSSFMDAQRTSLEAEAIIKFVPLTGEGHGLPHGQILLNNLSLQGIEHLAQGYRDDLEVLQAQIDDHNQRLNDLDVEIRQLTQNMSNLSLMAKQQEFMNTKTELVEREHVHLRQQQLFYLLDQALKDLGDNEPPLGLHLPGIDTMSTTSSSSSSSANEKKGGGLPSIFKIAGRKKQDVAKASSVSVFDFTKSDREQAWFFGAIPRPEANNLLVNEGDFLLRESTNSPGEMVLSVRNEGQIRHFKIQCDNGYFRFEGDAFPSIRELVQYHFKNKVAVTKKTKCVLVNAICKDKWQLTHDDIDIMEKLGSGNFGTVYKGLMKKTNEHVAVKTCKDNVDARTREKFLLEAKILKGYDHPNIVKLIGVCMDRQPIYIVMELVAGGDLLDYVKQNQNSLVAPHLVQLCKDACAGLAYLEAKKCIHRDVAARNCLVTEQSVVKITDFGMSREEDDGIYTVNGNMKAIPIRWTAPEAMLYGTFSSASDMWSFGVLSWEVFAFGKQPYPKMTNMQVRDEIAQGYRMPKQDNCPEKYYKEVMLPAWDRDPERRPRFCNAVHTIDSILNKL